MISGGANNLRFVLFSSCVRGMINLTGPLFKNIAKQKYCLRLSYADCPGSQMIQDGPISSNLPLF